MKKNKIKSAKKILRECFLGVIDFNEKAALHAMELYAEQFRTKVDSEVNYPLAKRPMGFKPE